MQGRKNIEPQLFYQISLEQLVPQDHVVRRLDQVLNLNWVRQATADYYPPRGRPSLDPVVIAKLLVLGYLFNLPSERQLMRDVQVNLAYRWYLGYDLDEAIPHHSDLSKARRRFGPAFSEKLFAYILGRCQEMGLVEGQTVFVDSTIVKANASLDSVTTVLHYRPAQYWEQLEQSDGAEAGAETSPSQPDPDDAEPTALSPASPSKASEPATEDSAKSPADKQPVLKEVTPSSGVDSAQGPSKSMGHKRPRRQRRCDQRRSKTDPEASLYHRPGKEAKIAYKAHFMADASEGVVTAVTATAACEDDTAAIPALLDRHRLQCPRPQEVVADHLYGSQDCLGYFQSRGIDTVIHPRQGGNKHGGFSKQDFDYDAQQDVYHCPGGQVLSRRRHQRKDDKVFYSAEPEVCGACSLRAQCVGSKKPQGVRQVTRYDNHYIERAEAACRSRRGRGLLKNRQTCIEGLFGQGKNFHGLGRAHWRGRVKMRVQALLTASILNLKKLLKAVFGRKGMVGILRLNPGNLPFIAVLTPELANALPSAFISTTHRRRQRIPCIETLI